MCGFYGFCSCVGYFVVCLCILSSVFRFVLLHILGIGVVSCDAHVLGVYFDSFTVNHFSVFAIVSISLSCAVCFCRFFMWRKKGLFNVAYLS